VNAASALLRGRRRAAPVALGLGALAVAAIAATGLLGADGNGARRATASGGGSVEVTRQTLVQRETVDGTLSYAGSRTVINRLGATSAAGDGSGDPTPATTPASFTADEEAPGADPEQPRDDEDEPAQPEGDEPVQPEDDEPAPRSATPDAHSDPDAEADSYTGSGTVTSLARAGSVVKRGGALYRLDGDPVVLMYGATPAFRALEQGVEDGRDVRQLERNLVALGFDPGTVDDVYSSSTATAVSEWQESAGLEQTGAVDLGRVVFLPGPRRIGEHKTTVGSVLSAGAEVLDTSSTKRVVTIELDATMQSLARKGAGVEVTLPDGAPVRGRISNIGRVAREVESSSTDPNAEQELVIDVTVELKSKRGLGSLDEAPVGVGLAQQSRRNVLAVPVHALVARRGGGYGVELADGRRIVPVEAGLFADGYVEVSGKGIDERTRVVVPGD
jgi:peptidoglycan hydrolase-like protein with peptidoglycan-binding domain